MWHERLPRVRILATALVALALLPASLTRAEVTDAEVEASVSRATAFLLDQQEQEWGFFKPDGDWGHWGKRGNDPRYHPPRHSSAMTSLAIMGLASVGHLPTDPTPEGRAVAKALEYMLMDDLRDEHGYFGERDSSQMYGHGIVTLMLAEMVGMVADEEQDRRIREVLNDSIKLILGAQKVRKDSRHQGGWRYGYHSHDSDISVTVWQVMALRAAKNAGLEVPKEAIDNAVSYLKRCYSGRRDRDPDDGAGFSYEAGQGGGSASTTAAGLLSLQVCGEYDCPEVEGGAKYLLKRPPEARQSWFFYAIYYYSQGMYQKGDEFADVAKAHTRDLLLPKQREDGSWLAENGSERKVGRVYSTSMALLSLSVQHQFLPIYQR